MRLYLPPGDDLFKAAINPPILSGDGYIYIALTVAAPDLFGPVVYRKRVGTDRFERVALAEPFPYPGSEGSLFIENGMLYLYGSTEKSELHQIQVLGFVPPAAGATTPQPAPTTNIDQQARDAAHAAMLQANNALGIAMTADRLATNATLALRERPTKEEVAEIAWQKAGDRIAFWWNRSIDYVDKQLYNAMFNRAVKALLYFKLITPEQARYNKDESLRM